MKNLQLKLFLHVLVAMLVDVNYTGDDIGDIGDFGDTGEGSSRSVGKNWGFGVLGWCFGGEGFSNIGDLWFWNYFETILICIDFEADRASLDLKFDLLVPSFWTFLKTKTEKVKIWMIFCSAYRKTIGCSGCSGCSGFLEVG